MGSGKGKDGPWTVLVQARSRFCRTRRNPAIAIQINTKIALREGRSVVSKNPGFPALSPGLLWSGNNGGPPRRAGHQSRPLPLLMPPGDSRVFEPFFIAALNSPYSARTARSWVRSAVSILFISCRNVHPSPVSFVGSKSTCGAPAPSNSRSRSPPRSLQSFLKALTVSCWGR